MVLRKKCKAGTDTTDFIEGNARYATCRTNRVIACRCSMVFLEELKMYGQILNLLKRIFPSKKGANIKIDKQLALDYAKQVKREMQAATARDMIRLVARKAKNLPLTTSKFGGLPYLPKNAQIPTNSKGEQLSLLAQINCTELPKNEIYPKNGILQFWILHNCSYGMDCDNFTNQENFRVIYYPQIGEHESSESLAKIYKPYKEVEGVEFFWKGAEFALNFALTTQSLTPSDYRFEENFVEKWNAKFNGFSLNKGEYLGLQLPSEVSDFLYDFERGDMHQIGGYPYFMQDDPRKLDNNAKFDTLLLQIDSQFNEDEKEWDIAWGDGGIIGFFMEPEKLKNLDFNEVFYIMDCA